MVVLNPLVLVLSNGDCLPFHCNAQDARYKYSSFDGVGLWAGRRTCMRTVRHCIPSCSRLPFGRRSLRKGLSAYFQLTREKNETGRSEQAFGDSAGTLCGGGRRVVGRDDLDVAVEFGREPLFELPR